MEKYGLYTVSKLYLKPNTNDFICSIYPYLSIPNHTNPYRIITNQCRTRIKEINK